MGPVDTACMSVQSSSGVLWIDVYFQQATDALHERCRRHARWCLHAYRLYDAPEDDDDLVQKALTDILGGHIQWDPTRRSLEDQVRDVIRYRVRDLKRTAARRRAHAPIIDVGDDCESHVVRVRGAEAVVTDEVVHAEMTRHGGEPDHPETQLRHRQARELGARICAELSVLVAEQDDEQAAAILTCWACGISERRDILAETGMSAETYHDARRRLIRLVGRLPDELRARGKTQTE